MYRNHRSWTKKQIIFSARSTFSFCVYLRCWGQFRRKTICNSLARCHKLWVHSPKTGSTHQRISPMSLDTADRQSVDILGQLVLELNKFENHSNKFTLVFSPSIPPFFLSPFTHFLPSYKRQIRLRHIRCHPNFRGTDWRRFARMQALLLHSVRQATKTGSQRRSHRPTTTQRCLTIC